MAGMVLDAGSAGDDATDAWEGPQVRGETGGLGTAQEHGLYALEGNVIQPGPATSATCSLEGSAAMTTPCVMPAAGGLTAYVEAVDDGGLVVPLPKQFGGNESTSLQS